MSYLITSLMFVFLSLFLSPSESQPLNSQCPGAQYSLNSSFATNLQSLFQTLNSTSRSSNFDTSTSGRGPDRVYGLYFCTADLPLADCHDCISTATSDILQSCPTNRQGIIWYDYCELRYSDQPFFGVPNLAGFSKTVPGQNDLAWPIQIVSELVEEVQNKNSSMFASYASLWEQKYAMLQCSGDLNQSACADCLTAIMKNIPGCCSQAAGWRYYAYSCWVRFDVIPFLKDIDSSNQIIGYNCSGDGFRSANASGSLASVLVDGGSVTGFYNTSIAVNGGRSYGLALCRGDVQAATCEECLTVSMRDLERSCGNASRGVIWYEKCWIRYANRDFFGVADVDGRVFCSDQEGIDEEETVVEKFMESLVEAAPKQALMFATGNVSVNGSYSGYGLVQCSRDLSIENCMTCLKVGMRNASNTCRRKKGWGYFSGSCSLRYHNYAFFQGSNQSISFSRPPSNSKIRGRALIIIITSTIAAALLLFMGYSAYMLVRRKHHDSDDRQWIYSAILANTSNPILIDMETIKASTNDFSDANKLGVGGFGPVYRGRLHDGQEIAIKRLSSESSQGTEEFKNEIRLISKLQHRNLVRLIGCCIQGQEKLLIYEFLPNGSLDSFLFDEHKHLMLDWKARRHIIFGILRGLVYLHEESLLKVVHRDLKASNVLLDLKMNAKISDFGMARIFTYGENEAHTGKVVGTYGYMAPEYAIHGVFSTKSDVFSFGVLMLEIISGQMNGRTHFTKYGQTLVQRASRLLLEDKGEEFIDPSIVDTCKKSEVLRAIHVALLCVQDNADDRPRMSHALHMLRNTEMALPEVKARAAVGTGSASRRAGRPDTINDMTVTIVEVR